MNRRTASAIIKTSANLNYTGITNTSSWTPVSHSPPGMKKDREEKKNMRNDMRKHMGRELNIIIIYPRMIGRYVGRSPALPWLLD